MHPNYKLARRAKVNELPMTELPLSRFSYHKEIKTLTTFESDLRTHAFDGTTPWLQRIYADACDVGIAILSETTKTVIKFVLTDVEKRDGDLVAWHFIPAPVQLAVVSKVTIFND